MQRPVHAQAVRLNHRHTSVDIDDQPGKAVPFAMHGAEPPVVFPAVPQTGRLSNVQTAREVVGPPRGIGRKRDFLALKNADRDAAIAPMPPAQKLALGIPYSNPITSSWRRVVHFDSRNGARKDPRVPLADGLFLSREQVDIRMFGGVGHAAKVLV